MVKSFLLLSLVFSGLGLVATAQEKKTNHPSPERTQLSTREPSIYYSLTDRKIYDDPKDFTTVEGSEISIDPKKLPKIRNQGGLPLCQTFCPTVLLDYKICESSGIEDCSSIEDFQRISPISTLMYRDTDRVNDEIVIGDIASAGDKQPFQILNAITSVGTTQFFLSESCLPYDRFLRAFENSEAKLSAYFHSIRVTYDEAKISIKKTSVIENCKECLELLTKFNLFLPRSASLKDLDLALKTKDFNSFRYSMLFRSQRVKENPNCRRIKLNPSVSVEHYPGPSDDFSSLQQVFTKMNEILATKRPVILSPVCIARRVSDNSCDYHCFVIAGRKLVRNNSTGKVIELLRVHNSWGEKWQEINNDGWIPAESLKSKMTTYDDKEAAKPSNERRKAYSHSISWLE